MSGLEYLAERSKSAEPLATPGRLVGGRCAEDVTSEVARSASTASVRSAVLAELALSSDTSAASTSPSSGMEFDRILEHEGLVPAWMRVVVPSTTFIWLPTAAMERLIMLWDSPPCTNLCSMPHVYMSSSSMRWWRRRSWCTSPTTCLTATRARSFLSPIILRSSSWRRVSLVEFFIGCPPSRTLITNATRMPYVHTAAERTSQPLQVSSCVTSARRPGRSLPTSSKTVHSSCGPSSTVPTDSIFRSLSTFSEDRTFTPLSVM
mmetsp:Transcript_2428/g.7021  ORF Transcript_2428/g.7021 Transcript_2428/m.7021 type:complete len:263 (+) Transcript_2428:870-1658(+)